MVDIAGVNEFGDSTQEHVVIPLLGQVKGEDHTRQHLIHCANETSSGIQVRRWMVRLKWAHSVLKRERGPAFVNTVSGLQSTTSEMNDLFVKLLMEIFEDHRDLAICNRYPVGR